MFIYYNALEILLPSNMTILIDQIKQIIFFKIKKIKIKINKNKKIMNKNKNNK